MPEKTTDTPLLTKRFDDALLYATKHHRNQLRKGGRIPYAAHLLGVAAITLEMEASEDEAIGALLHDVVEDGGGREAAAYIEATWGPDVARIVLANSDADVEPKPPWRGRKEEYVAAVAHKRPDELRVSLADKLHNARAVLLDYRTLGDDLWRRFSAPDGGAGVRWYYRALLDGFTARAADMGPGAAPALEELRRTVDEIDALAG